MVTMNINIDGIEARSPDEARSDDALVGLTAVPARPPPASYRAQIKLSPSAGRTAVCYSTRTARSGAGSGHGAVPSHPYGPIPAPSAPADAGFAPVLRTPAGTSGEAMAARVTLEPDR
jgi:hypothetical protein